MVENRAPYIFGLDSLQGSFVRLPEPEFASITHRGYKNIVKSCRQAHGHLSFCQNQRWPFYIGLAIEIFLLFIESDLASLTWSMSAQCVCCGKWLRNRDNEHERAVRRRIAKNGELHSFIVKHLDTQGHTHVASVDMKQSFFLLLGLPHFF